MIQLQTRIVAEWMSRTGGPGDKLDIGAWKQEKGEPDSQISAWGNRTDEGGIAPNTGLELGMVSSVSDEWIRRVPEDMQVKQVDTWAEDTDRETPTSQG